MQWNPRSYSKSQIDMNLRITQILLKKVSKSVYSEVYALLLLGHQWFSKGFTGPHFFPHKWSFLPLDSLLCSSFIPSLSNLTLPMPSYKLKMIFVFPILAFLLSPSLGFYFSPPAFTVRQFLRMYSLSIPIAHFRVLQGLTVIDHYQQKTVFCSSFCN